MKEHAQLCFYYFKAPKCTPFLKCVSPMAECIVFHLVSGAGDCLTAGFVCGLLQGRSQHQCVLGGMQGMD